MKRTLTLLAAIVIMLDVMLGVRTFAGTATADKSQTTTADKPHMSMTGKSYTIEDRVKHLNEKLSFTADQKTKVTEIFKASRVQELSDKLKDSKLNKTAHTAAMTDMKTEMDAVNQKIEAVLTDSQKAEFKKMILAKQMNNSQWKSEKKTTPPSKAGNN